VFWKNRHLPLFFCAIWVEVSLIVICVINREFVSCVRSIKILSPSEVSQMNQEKFEMLDAPPMQQQQPSMSNSDQEARCTQTSAPNPQMGGP
jgi:hypothetical protein